MSQLIKFSGTDLFDGHQFLGPDKVLILDTAGTVQAIVDKNEAGGDIQHLEGFLSPGFVNTHCHLELSHMKGVIPEKTGLPAFLTAVMTQRGSPSPETEAQLTAAETAMWEQGIAAVGDICNGTATLAQKEQGRLYYHSFIECLGFIDAAAPQRFEQSRVVYEQFRALNGPRHSSSLAPHAPYSVSATLFELLAGLPDNTPLTIHNQESEAENELYREKTGPFLDFYQRFGMDISGFEAGHTSSLQAILSYLSGSPLLLVHNTFSAEADVLAVQQRDLPAYWCLCPQANLYIEDRLPDINLLRRMGCTITLGTDSLASNHQLSIWSEIQTIRHHFPEIPTVELMQWATFNGARALGITDRYGSFAKGTKPGVVEIVNAQPRRVL